MYLGPAECLQQGGCLDIFHLLFLTLSPAAENSLDASSYPPCVLISPPTGRSRRKIVASLKRTQPGKIGQGNIPTQGWGLSPFVSLPSWSGSVEGKWDRNKLSV
jgi:hypothetical protein